ncbi:WD40 repeat-like protein [Piedraia hortae CBS 480.64]|uniref:WD40 repeat-like protein n=1 Tax=Piedraia hortae CBS 480.64 TaxID=1314780 RepID=A0A6A7C3D6_9PEZI|nr:WD40 repeat-like protein [Piedraia hortae CBS 480.64]
MGPDRRPPSGVRERLKGFLSSNRRLTSSVSNVTQRGPDDLHQLAEEALERLTDDERNVIRTLQDSDGDMSTNLTRAHDKAIQRLQAELSAPNRRDWIFTKTERMLSWLGQFKDTGQAFAQTQPITIGAVWAGISTLIVIAEKRKDLKKALVDGLDIVMHTCSLLCVYTDRLSSIAPSNDKDRLRKALIDLLYQVYMILANAIITQKAHVMQRTVQALSADNKLKGAKERCLELCKRVEECLHNCEYNETKAWRTSLKSRLDATKDVNRGLTNTIARVEEKIDLSHLDAVLSRLRVAKGATYKAGKEGEDFSCLSGTRVAILQQIADWAENFDESPILWLRGKAGTGKSTLARSIAEQLDGTFLVPSFFFKRDQNERGNVHYLVPTIARQLADKIPNLADEIAKVLKDSQAGDYRLKFQFEELLQKPLEKAHMGHQIVIVIDSLDECKDDAGIKTTLNYLVRIVQIDAASIKIILTSRPDPIMEAGFRKMGPKLYMEMVLEEVQQESIEDDMRLFLQAKLAEIRENQSGRPPNVLDDDWPGDEAFEALIKHSMPLFIAAATTCRFISKSNPRKQMDYILKWRYDNSLSGLGATYHPILEHAAVDSPGEWMDLFQRIVQPLIILEDSLSATALAELFDHTTDDIYAALDPLYSVVHVPINDSFQPITTYHLSFRDFLVSVDDRRFRINERELNEKLLDKCLNLLGTKLKIGMCGPMCPGSRRVNVPQQYISNAVAYASRHWVSHLLKSAPDAKSFQRVDGFLRVHFLHWIETLGWLGRMDEAVHTMGELRFHAIGDDLKPFLHDACRWILRFRSIIETAPLQTYYSALVMTPWTSPTRDRFHSVIDKYLEVRPWVPWDWGAELQRLDCQEDVYSVAISPDGKSVGVALRPGEVRLWDTETGTVEPLLHTLPHTRLNFLPQRKTLVAISNWLVQMIDIQKKADEVLFDARGSSSIVCAITPDLQTVALWSDGEMVLYDIRTKTAITRFEAPAHQSPPVVYSPDAQSTLNALPVAFSPDSKTVGFQSLGNTVGLWCTGTGRLKARYNGHSKKLRKLTFSPDGYLVASMSSTTSVQVWNAQTGAEVKTILSNANIRDVEFLPDGKVLACAMYNGTIRLRNLDTDLESILRVGGKGGLTLIAVCSSINRMVSGMPNGMVKVWSTEMASRAQRPYASFSRIAAMTFLPDETTVVVGSRKESVRLVDIKHPLRRNYLEGDCIGVDTLELTSDGKMLAAGCRDRTLRLWDVETNVLKFKVEEHIDRVLLVRFSPDKRTLASGSLDQTIRLWDMTTGKRLWSSDRLKQPVDLIEFSPDSKAVAVGCQRDNSVQLYNVETDSPKSCFEFDKNISSIFAVSMGGQVLVSCADRTLRIWDSKVEAQTLVLGTDVSVKSAKFLPDGRVSLSAKWPKMMWCWKAERGAPDLALEWPGGQAVILTSCSATENAPALLQSHDTSPTLKSYSNARYFKVEDPTRGPCPNPHLDIGNEWITYGNCELFWLPDEYGRKRKASLGRSLIFGNQTNSLACFRFREEWLAEIQNLGAEHHFCDGGAVTFSTKS